MLRRLAGIILLLGIVAALASFLADQPGETVIDWLGWRLSLPTSLLLAILLVLLWLLVMLDRVLAAVVRLPGRLGGRWAERRRQAGQQALTLGLVAAAAGDGHSAARHGRRARQLLGETPLTGLVSAQAAALNGDTEASSRFFHQLTEDRDTRFVGQLGLMRLAAETGDHGAALEAGRAAFAARHDSATLARALFVLEAREGNWKQARNALAIARRQGNLEAAAADDAEITLLIMQAEQEQEPKAAVKLLQRALDLDAGASAAAIRAGKLLLALNSRGSRAKSAAILEKSFLATAHPQTATLLMESAWTGDDAARLAKLISLARRSGTGSGKGNIGSQAEALTIAAEWAVSIGLWGEALGLVCEIAPADRDSRSWQVLAGIARHLAEAEPQTAKTLSRTWPDDIAMTEIACLQQAASASQPACWRCRQCGAASSRWQAFCDACSSFASISWMRQVMAVARLAAAQQEGQNPQTPAGGEK